MLTIDEAIKAVKAGATALKLQHGGVTFRCSTEDGECTFRPSFPRQSPVLPEGSFRSIYYGKQFEVVKAKAKPPSAEN